jgi:SAM-dependent methyltransferase
VFKTIIKQALKTKKIICSKKLKNKFSQMYEQNIFGGIESLSGEGSSLEQTQEIRLRLPELIEEFEIKSFIDAPCGDWYWMQHTNLGVSQYCGVDIVEEMIEKNQTQYGTSTIKFECLNLAQDSLPKADIIFCRDCLVHLQYSDIKKVLKNFKRSGAKYLLTTTFIERKENSDLVGNDIWRTLNLQLSPFNFPAPLKLIKENCTEYNGNFDDKHLGLWLLDDLEL